MGNRAKKELRLEMKRIVSSLDKRWLKAASFEICQRLSALLDNELGPGIRHVLAWTSFFPGEADLSAFIGEQLEK